MTTRRSNDMGSRNLLIILAAAGLLFAGLVMYSHRSPTHKIQMKAGEVNDLDAEITFWSNRVDLVGPTRAYSEFSDSAASLSRHDQHVAAHAFGISLFNSAGLAGLTTCGDEFGGGCRHSFFGIAFGQYGIENGTTMLATVCASATTTLTRRSCYHGIGHGALGFQGYDIRNLNKTLVMCTGFKEKNPTLGCLGGAFMEFNSRILERMYDVPPRPFTADKRFELCQDVPPAYQLACIFWQPAWWSSAWRGEIPAVSEAAQLGEYCTQLEKFSVRRARVCFKGLGYIAPIELAPEAKLAAQFCANVSDKARDRLACWAYAGPQLHLSTDDKPRDMVCAGLTGIEYAYCEAHNADFTDFNASLEPTNE